MNSYKPIVHSVIAFNIYTRDTYTYGTKIPFSQIAFTFFSQLEYTSCLCTNQMIPGKDTCTCYFNIYGTNPRMRTVGEDPTFKPNRTKQSLRVTKLSETGNKRAKLLHYITNFLQQTNLRA